MKIRLIQKAIDILRNKKANAYIRGKHTCVDKSSVIDSHCEIGDYTSVGRDVDITRAKIGRYCSIASHVRIGQGEHNLDEVSTSTLLSYRGGYHDLTQKDCIIKNDVWIGVNAVIRRGVTVGNGAVVGANSFVNKDVPDLPLWEVVRRELSNSDLMKKHKKELLRRPIGIMPPKTRKNY